MKKLEGKKIALLGSRKIEEISKIVENMGGVAISRPAQGTSLRVDTKLKEHIELISSGEFDWILFTTGIGVETLYNTAQEIAKGEEFIKVLQNSQIAARGYKTVNMLKKLGVASQVRDDDGSTAGLIRSLEAYSLKNKKVALQLHGDPAPKLIQWLEEQKAQSEEILPYIHHPPEAEVMEKLLSELLNGELDAAVFTSTPQVRNLIQFAREQGAEDRLQKAFSEKVIALAVGKVTAQALYDEGIDRVIFPEHERMGSAIVELANHYQKISVE
ncbi:uroporphyrinogen-III synthase [Sporosarcina globispora]|uniref:Uroporphyrinogen-III synthase n=1 Tax=Sporosarcina globispora TaxID=1459 RepID=A0A0M0GGT5_SPOGL|nr:uroporphyrinogen-III synthase [Sporosarcina globispora]KON88707.1 uroporphyrinogen-III synthase [Sporosarcina globispora]